MDFYVSQSQVIEMTLAILRNKTVSLSMLQYNCSAYFKDTTGHEINHHQLLHISSNNNY